MGLIKIAKVTQKDIDAYNKQYKEKSDIHSYTTPLIGSLAGLGVGRLLDKAINNEYIKLTPGLIVGGAVGGWGLNHVRVHNKIDKKIRNKMGFD